MPIYQIKKPDKEDAEKTFIGNCAGKILFLSVLEPLSILEPFYHLPINLDRTSR